MNKTVDTFFCTRPRLAVLLMENGHEARKVPNPYNPRYAAWEFHNIPEVRAIVANFYKNIKGGEHRE